MKLLIYLLLVFTIMTSTANAAVLAFSDNGSYVAKTTLAAAAVAADCAGKRIVFTSSQTLTANLVWPADRELVQGSTTATIATAGYTLTIDQAFHAPSRVVFTGTGTVIINGGEIDVAWFDGTDASTKWAFCARGILNTNGLGKIVVFSAPKATDAWATTFRAYGTDPVWGPRWRVDAPIVIDSPQQATVIRTPAGFVATTAMSSMWQIGTATGALKVDYIHFPDKLSIEGNYGLCQYAGIMYGSSHMHIPYQEIYRTAGWLMQPTMNKQVSDVKFDFIDAGYLYGPALILDGSAGPNNSITDLIVDFINSDGFYPGYAPSGLVMMESNYNGIKLGKIVHRALAASGAVDATAAVVVLTNVGATAPSGVYYPPRYDIHIGPVTNGSNIITARAIVFSDNSGGVAAKFNGVTIESGSCVVDGLTLPSDISLFYATGTVVQGLTPGRKLIIASDCSGTIVTGISRADIIDSGSNTFINGRIGPGTYGINSPTVTASPMTFVNTYLYDMDFLIQGGTVVSVVFTRATVPVAFYSGASLGYGIYRLAPGDSITVTYSAAPTMRFIPR